MRYMTKSNRKLEHCFRDSSKIYYFKVLYGKINLKKSKKIKPKILCTNNYISFVNWTAEVNRLKQSLSSDSTLHL